VGGMADVRRPGDPLGQPSDGKNPAPAGELLEEPEGRADLGRRRPSVGRRRSGMRRDDVPAEDVEVELGKRPPNDRRRRLGGACAGELALGRERDPADPRAPIARRLADEDDLCVAPRSHVRTGPLAEVRGLRVLVVRLTDARGGESRYEVGFHPSGQDFGGGTRHIIMEAQLPVLMAR